MHDKLKHGKVVILHGIFQPKFFDTLKAKNPKEVFVLEGRPDLASSRETTRQLLKRKITPTIISDNMAGFLFYKKMVKEVWLAYQSTDEECTLCRIGALVLAVLCKTHKIPLYVSPTGKISKFLGASESLTHFNGAKVAASGVKAFVPLVECVPSKYIRKIYE